MIQSITFPLKDKLGRICTNEKPEVIRFHCVFTENDEKQYYYRFLLLCNPWRRAEEVVSHQSYKPTFEQLKQQSLPTITKYNLDPDDLGPETWNNVAALQQEDQEKKSLEGVIRIRKSKDRRHNGQMKKDKRTKNDLQSIHIQLKSEKHLPS